MPHCNIPKWTLIMNPLVPPPEFSDVTWAHACDSRSAVIACIKVDLLDAGPTSTRKFWERKAQLLQAIPEYFQFPHLSFGRRIRLRLVSPVDISSDQSARRGEQGIRESVPRLDVDDFTPSKTSEPTRSISLSKWKLFPTSALSINFFTWSKVLM